MELAGKKCTKRRTYTEEQRQASRDRARRYYSANRGAVLEYQAELRKKDPTYQNQYQRKYQLKQYGLTPAAYNYLLDGQESRCACCGREDSGRKTTKHFCVDHDHETGQVRGLLCHPCNAGIGKLGDDLDLAIHRLQQYKLHAETKTQQLLDQHSAEA